MDKGNHAPSDRDGSSVRRRNEDTVKEASVQHRNDVNETSIQYRKTAKVLSIYALLLIALVTADQLTKQLALHFLKGQEDIVLWNGVFRLHYLENSSAAFGMDPVSLLQDLIGFSWFTEHPDAFLKCRMAFFIILTVLVLLLLFFLFLKIPAFGRFVPLNLTLVFFAAGAVGNLIDRIVNQYVIDFFYFELIDFPVFNVADIYVTVSAVVLIILSFFYYKEADYEILFPQKDGDRSETTEDERASDKSQGRIKKQRVSSQRRYRDSSGRGHTYRKRKKERIQRRK